MIPWATVEGEWTLHEGTQWCAGTTSMEQGNNPNMGGQKNTIPGDTGVTHADVDYGLA